MNGAAARGMIDMSQPHSATKSGNHPEVGHLVPWQVLAAVFVALIVLTVLTVLVTLVDLGAMNLWIAMIVATVKATLVCLYFMHLRYDRAFNSIVLVFSVLFLLLFVGFAMTDSVAYQHELLPPTHKDYASGAERFKQ